MAKHWEITGRLGELQLQWLRAHYTEQQLAETLAKLPKKGFPFNVAKRLEAAGGPKCRGLWNSWMLIPKARETVSG